MRKIPCCSGKMAENIPPLLSSQPLQEVQNVTRRVKHERSWKDEEIETLIGLYEGRVCLWDFGSEEYINRDVFLHQQRNYNTRSSSSIFRRHLCCVSKLIKFALRARCCPGNVSQLAQTYGNTTFILCPAHLRAQETS